MKYLLFKFNIKNIFKFNFFKENLFKGINNIFSFIFLISNKPKNKILEIFDHKLKNKIWTFAIKQKISPSFSISSHFKDF